MKSIRLVSLSFSLVWARFDQLQVAVAKDGYAVTNHEVQTSDGWKLQLIHLTKALLTDWRGNKIPIQGLVEPSAEVKATKDAFAVKNETTIDEVIFEEEPMDNLFSKLLETNIIRRPVLLQTSSGLNADDWFKYVPKENNLPYKLLDLGFDVWIGNNRGVYDYSANISYRAN